MKMSSYKAILLTTLMLSAVAAHADQKNGSKGTGTGSMKMDSMGEMAANASGMAEGQVKAVDQTGKNITLKHGPIRSKTVEMPPMTMSFAVQKSSLLEKVKVGDKVKFNVENVKGTVTVTNLQVEK